MEQNFLSVARLFRFVGRSPRWILVLLPMFLLPIAGLQKPTVAAERIYLSYAALESSIPIEALETYAEEGKLTDELAFYAQDLSPQQLAQLRRVLLTQIDLNPVEVSQFLYTPIGKQLLQRLGELVQTEARLSGFYALRAALILAAADSDGLTLLNVLKKFPTDGIRVNLRRSLQIVNEIERLINQTDQAIALVERQAAVAATSQSNINFSQLPSIRQPGSFSWNKQTLTVDNPRRKRAFVADLYLPRETGDRRQETEGRQKRQGGQGSNYQLPTTNYQIPVIVISHGLGSNRMTFEYLAQRLASYGFAVAVPEHLGSGAERLRSVLGGRYDAVVEPDEFINRPLDVTYLLNELEGLDAASPNVELNLQQVGIIGQSFGGYTALALAGGELNFAQLRNNCGEDSQLFNASLLLQCRALGLTRRDYNLRDPRIKAAMAINPIASSVFGQAGLKQIQIPVAIVSSGADRVAPALAEQIQPFSWLTAPEKYLILLEDGTHFSALGVENPVDEPLTIPTQLIGPNPALARRYINILSTAFFQTYIANQPQYRPYLSAAFAQTISQAPLEIDLVQSLPAERLTELLN